MTCPAISDHPPECLCFLLPANKIRNVYKNLRLECFANISIKTNGGLTILRCSGSSEFLIALQISYGQFLFGSFLVRFIFTKFSFWWDFIPQDLFGLTNNPGRHIDRREDSFYSRFRSPYFTFKISCVSVSDIFMLTLSDNSLFLWNGERKTWVYLQTFCSCEVFVV